MTERELRELDQPFWHLDEELGELMLRERPSGPDLYRVRLKARTAASPYHAKRELYPLSHDGTEHEVSGKAYILVPDVTVTVGLFEQPVPSSAIGMVKDTHWQGMRHHEIASVRGLYYEEDQALGVWEVDAWNRLPDETHGQLWQLFECWLIMRYPNATRIFTDDAEPGEDEARNREFLSALGYQHAEGTHRIFVKELSQQYRMQLQEGRGR